MAVHGVFEVGAHLEHMVVQPKFTWSPIIQPFLQDKRRIVLNESQPNSVELLSIIRVNKPTGATTSTIRVDDNSCTIDRNLYPFARLDRTVCITTNDVQHPHLVLEAPSPAERDWLVVALKLIVARLASIIIVRDEEMLLEFFSPYSALMQLEADAGEPPSSATTPATATRGVGQSPQDAVASMTPPAPGAMLEGPAGIPAPATPLIGHHPQRHPRRRYHRNPQLRPRLYRPPQQQQQQQRHQQHDHFCSTGEDGAFLGGDEVVFVAATTPVAAPGEDPDDEALVMTSDDDDAEEHDQGDRSDDDDDDEEDGEAMSGDDDADSDPDEALEMITDDETDDGDKADAKKDDVIIANVAAQYVCHLAVGERAGHGPLMITCNDDYGDDEIETDNEGTENETRQGPPSSDAV
jgi:hypothetical protein